MRCVNSLSRLRLAVASADDSSFIKSDQPVFSSCGAPPAPRCVHRQAALLPRPSLAPRPQLLRGHLL